MSQRRPTIVILLATLCLVALGTWLFPPPPNTLVVYCAHDAQFAEPILRRFEQQTRIPLEIRFDTEATKSLGLVELLRRQADRPQADVFWNNELLGMLDLQEAGLLDPYRGTGFGRMPDRFKDAEGAWVGFAARFRVYISNYEQLPGLTEDQLAACIASAPKLFAKAKPLYGTTRAHYTVLWQQWGAARLKAWHADTAASGAVEAHGNAMVKDLVASGACQIGWTDTDDFFAARAAGAPVAMHPWRLEGGETVCIPNCVAIVKKTRHRAAAERLVDFLLSAETEQALAESAARQVPLGPVPLNELPRDVQSMRDWVEESVDLRQLGAARGECLAWLRTVYTP